MDNGVTMAFPEFVYNMILIGSDRKQKQFFRAKTNTFLDLNVSDIQL